MRGRTRIAVVELADALRDLEDLDGYLRVRVLARLHGTPIGFATVPIRNGRVPAASLMAALLDQLHGPIIRHLLQDLMAAPPPGPAPRADDLVRVPHPAYDGPLPSLTVAVCTRDRTDDLDRCLGALVQMPYPDLDILVVDNAPRTDGTARLVRDHFPQVRYVREPRPGLDWARNRAILEARGDVIAYTDDDVIVDPAWARAIGTAFARNPDVAAVTGLVAPYELETDAQILFEENGGFARGFSRRWWRTGEPGIARWMRFGTGAYGTGANMAFRRSTFDAVGRFDPALDVGTVTNGGGDLDMLFRVVQAGMTVLYDPEVLVFHRHRRSYQELRRQIDNNGVALVSSFVRAALHFPEERRDILRLAWWYVRHWSAPRLVKALTRPGALPLDLVAGEALGGLRGLPRYHLARQAAARIEQEHGPQRPEHDGDAAQAPASPSAAEPVPSSAADAESVAAAAGSDGWGIAVRVVDLAVGAVPIRDVAGYAWTRVEVVWAGRPRGSFIIPNGFQSIGADRLTDDIADNLGARVLEPAYGSRSDVDAEALAEVRRWLLPGGRPRDEESPGPPPSVDVSVVVATCDRPDDLARCLESLVRQETARAFEVIVVDNVPSSGLTPPIVARFPGVRLVTEARAGASYARNAGVLASRGAIIATTDDDVVAPPYWLERLVQPFARPDVMAVTGNVLPLELDTASQRAFEAYGGLARGYDVREHDDRWFSWFGRRAVPTWELGGTANNAFRASVFADSRIGLFDEALGPGTPTGVGEDTYIYYRILKAGHTIIYEPAAWVQHRHRRDNGALRRQLSNYSTGHIAYHLTTLCSDRDMRGLVQIVAGVPRSYLWRIRERLAGRSNYPLRFLLTEVRGHLRGPLALWQSRRRVGRLGRSERTISAPSTEGQPRTPVLPARPPEAQTGALTD